MSHLPSSQVLDICSTMSCTAELAGKSFTPSSFERSGNVHWTRIIVGVPVAGVIRHTRRLIKTGNHLIGPREIYKLEEIESCILAQPKRTNNTVCHKQIMIMRMSASLVWGAGVQ